MVGLTRPSLGFLAICVSLSQRRRQLHSEWSRLGEHRLGGAVFGPLLLLVWSLEIKHCFLFELVGNADSQLWPGLPTVF